MVCRGLEVISTGQWWRYENLLRVSTCFVPWAKAMQMTESKTFSWNTFLASGLAMDCCSKSWLLLFVWSRANVIATCIPAFSMDGSWALTKLPRCLLLLLVFHLFLSRLVASSPGESLFLHAMSCSHYKNLCVFKTFFNVSTINETYFILHFLVTIDLRKLSLFFCCWNCQWGFFSPSSVVHNLGWLRSSFVLFCPVRFWVLFYVSASIVFCVIFIQRFVLHNN